MENSIIVVTYNSISYIGSCLTSIYADMTAQDEIIVVDNDSTDGTAAYISARFPAIKLVYNNNTGYADGNNVGAAIAQGRTLVFLNPDTTIESGTLAALTQPLKQHSTIGMTTACVLYMNRPDTINTCGNTIHYTGLAYCRGANKPRADFQQRAQVDSVSGSSFAISRELFVRLGGFDTRFFMYVEDTDLSLRVSLLGYQIMYTPEAVVYHDYMPRYSPRKAFYLDRNRHLMLLKCVSPSIYIRLLPGLALSELVTGAFMILNGPAYWTVKPKVYWSIWQERARTAAARKSLAARPELQKQVFVRLTHVLDFGQLASRALTRIAEGVLHPAFWLAKQLLN